MRTLTVSKLISDEVMKDEKGKYVDDSSYHTLITEDCDVMTDEGHLLLKFRKKIMSDDEIDIGFHAFKPLAKSSRGRGAAAGMIDPTDQYWKKRKLVDYKKWSATYESKKKDGKVGVSSMKISHEVASCPIGFFGKTELGKNLPCRLSHFTQHDYMRYQSGIPYISKLSESYSKLNPDEYSRQMERAQLNPHLQIDETPFSTITVNRNFRTGIHKDGGDFGFGNLSCLEYGSYSGGYFVFPQFGIACDMRAGDHLCCDVHQYHANTELYETEEDKLINDSLEDIYHDNLEIGVKGLNNRFARISLVCYLREDLIKCDAPVSSYFEPVFGPKNVFYINLKKDKERRKKFLVTKYVRWPASERSDVTEEMDKKMVSYHNLSRQDHLAKCACLMSHLNLLKRCVELKIDNIFVLEDDALQLGNLPLTKTLAQDKFTYLGGFIKNKKITSSKPVVIEHMKGRNILDTDKYQMLMTMSYYVPTWQLAQQIIQNIESQKRYRGADIMFFKSIPSEYIYPALFIEEHVPSNIRSNKDHHCTKEYEFVHHKKRI